MTAHEAAVQAMAGALYGETWFADVEGEDAVEECRRLSEHSARAAAAALATSPDVRAGLVRAVNEAEGWYDPAGAYTAEGEPIAGIRVWVLVDAVLGALGAGAMTDDGGAP